jgi:hypothetical protein
LGQLCLFRSGQSNSPGNQYNISVTLKTPSLLQVNTSHVLHHFFEKKGDFEINAQKILEEFCLQFFLCV